LKGGEIQDGKTLGLTSENRGELVEVKQFGLSQSYNVEYKHICTLYLLFCLVFFIFNFPYVYVSWLYSLCYCYNATYEAQTPDMTQTLWHR